MYPVRRSAPCTDAATKPGSGCWWRAADRLWANDRPDTSYAPVARTGFHSLVSVQVAAAQKVPALLGIQPEKSASRKMASRQCSPRCNADSARSSLVRVPTTITCLMAISLDQSLSCMSTCSNSHHKSILILAGSALGMSQPVLSFSGRLRT